MICMIATSCSCWVINTGASHSAPLFFKSKLFLWPWCQWSHSKSYLKKHHNCKITTPDKKSLTLTDHPTLVFFEEDSYFTLFKVVGVSIEEALKSIQAWLLAKATKQNQGDTTTYSSCEDTMFYKKLSLKSEIICW